MKKSIIIVAAAMAALFAVSSCGNKVYKAGDRMPETTSAKIDSISYALGMYYGSTLTNAPFGEINLAELQKGFDDQLAGNVETKIKQEEVSMLIQMYLMQRQAYVANAEKEKAAEFLLKNKEKEGVIETESGLQYKVIKAGKGEIPTKESSVKVNYKGTLIDGTEFDSSYKRNAPATFRADQVIKGWTEALTMMPVGSKWELYIPQELAYGARETGGQIKPFSTLIFEVELLEIEKKK